VSFGHHAKAGEAAWRRDQIAEFERFCRRQSSRVQRRLEIGVERIQDARFREVEGEEMTLVDHRRA
jgi:hypothetical protein